MKSLSVHETPHIQGVWCVALECFLPHEALADKEMIRPTIETVCHSPFVCVEYYVPSRPMKLASVGVGEILISLDGVLEFQLPPEDI